MGRTSAWLFTLAFVVAATIAAPTQALDDQIDMWTPPTPGEETCVTTGTTTHKGDDLHIDLYISDVTYKDGQLYLNGKPYPQTLVKILERVLDRVLDADPMDYVPTNPNNPGAPFNPVLNPPLNQLLGPLIDWLEDLDPNELPIVEIEMRIPVPDDDVDGVRLFVVVDTPVCMDELPL